MKGVIVVEAEDEEDIKQMKHELTGSFSNSTHYESDNLQVEEVLTEESDTGTVQDVIAKIVDAGVLP